MHATKRLMAAISEKNSRMAVGLDPTLELMPEKYLPIFMKLERENFRRDSPEAFKIALEEAKIALYDYSIDIIDAVYDIASVIKPNIAFYEAYHAYDVYFRVCEYAKQKGPIVIADAKRGDISSTSMCYSKAFFDEQISYEACDFLTINPYFGEDSIEPFIELCDKNDKGVFILVKTSNKSSSQIQDLMTIDGGRVYQKVAELVADWGTIDKHTGYSNVGAVVGATHPNDAAKLREAMPNTFFLVPGFGAQGATVEDVLVNFDSQGGGAIINASRSILGAFKKEKYQGMDFQTAARTETIRMRDDINAAIEKKFGKLV